LKKTRKALEESINSIQWWNTFRFDLEPMDVGFEKSMLHFVDNQLAAWKIDDMEAVELWQSKMNRLASQASVNITCTDNATKGIESIQDRTEEFRKAEVIPSASEAQE
jgi:hypothetical protein